MLTKFIALLGSRKTEAPPDQQCESCIYYIDYRDLSDEPDEMNGYCCFDFVTGNTSNKYGGHWTHHTLWCKEWQAGKPIFPMVASDESA